MRIFRQLVRFNPSACSYVGQELDLHSARFAEKGAAGVALPPSGCVEELPEEQVAGRLRQPGFSEAVLLFPSSGSARRSATAAASGTRPRRGAEEGVCSGPAAA